MLTFDKIMPSKIQILYTDISYNEYECCKKTLIYTSTRNSIHNIENSVTNVPSTLTLLSEN
jgi:hypothetical protein